MTAASPKQADVLVITGPVNRKMQIVLERIAEEMPRPAMIVAIGDCAVSGGVFGRSPAFSDMKREPLTPGRTLAACPPAGDALKAALTEAA